MELAERGDDLRRSLFDNARNFRAAMTKAGFDLLPGEHPIIPVMLGEARLAQDLASRLFDDGVYVAGFFYPVVPQGKARIRTQMSAGLSPSDIDRAVAAFTRAGKAMQII
jgi:glycine C-acetyltransferase